MKSIIVSGGSTCIKNFNSYLQNEMDLYMNPQNKLKIYNLSEKVNSGWFGGAILSNLGTF